MEVTAIFEKDDEWWIAWTEEVPGAFGQGHTLEECRESLRDAVQMMLEEIHAQSLQETEGRPVIRERITVSL